MGQIVGLGSGSSTGHVVQRIVSSAKEARSSRRFITERQKDVENCKQEPTGGQKVALALLARRFIISPDRLEHLSLPYDSKREPFLAYLGRSRLSQS